MTLNITYTKHNIIKSGSLTTLSKTIPSIRMAFSILTTTMTTLRITTLTVTIKY
jgi:hypothetical protein